MCTESKYLGWGVIGVEYIWFGAHKQTIMLWSNRIFGLQAKDSMWISCQREGVTLICIETKHSQQVIPKMQRLWEQKVLIGSLLCLPDEGPDLFGSRPNICKQVAGIQWHSWLTTALLLLHWVCKMAGSHRAEPRSTDSEEIQLIFTCAFEAEVHDTGWNLTRLHSSHNGERVSLTEITDKRYKPVFTLTTVCQFTVWTTSKSAWQRVIFSKL